MIEPEETHPLSFLHTQESCCPSLRGTTRSPKPSNSQPCFAIARLRGRQEGERICSVVSVMSSGSFGALAEKEKPRHLALLYPSFRGHDPFSVAVQLRPCFAKARLRDGKRVKGSRIPCTHFPFSSQTLFFHFLFLCTFCEKSTKIIGERKTAPLRQRRIGNTLGVRSVQSYRSSNKLFIIIAQTGCSPETP